eukprot:7224648-Alexandrium_andersonii.AAC.1
MPTTVPSLPQPQQQGHWESPPKANPDSRRRRPQGQPTAGPEVRGDRGKRKPRATHTHATSEH